MKLSTMRRDDHVDMLAHYITRYDRLQVNKKYYNPYAIGIYLEAAKRVKDECQNTTLREALLNNFNGRLLSHMLKSCGLADFTKEEMR